MKGLTSMLKCAKVRKVRKVWKKAIAAFDKVKGGGGSSTMYEIAKDNVKEAHDAYTKCQDKY